MKTGESQKRKYWIPVEKHGNTYLPARDWKIASLDPIPENELRPYITNHFRSTEAEVLLDDTTYAASIFVPVTVEDHAYVLVDEAGVPVQSSGPSPAEEPELTTYMDQVREHLSLSEALFPEQRCYIWTEFLQPNLSIQDELKQPQQTVSDWRTICSSARVLIIGAPGAGKTTLMRRLAIELADSDAETSYKSIPLYVQLRTWSDSGGIDRLVRRELSRLAPPVVVKRLGAFASAGQCVFLFDGLDEVAIEKRHDVIADISLFIKSYPRSRFVISGRPGRYFTSFGPDFQRCHVNPLQSSQIKELCWQKLEGRERGWSRFWTRLISEREIYEICSNPLVLSLLLTKHVRDAVSPHYVTDIVTAIVEALLGEWDSVRGVTRSLDSKLTPRLRFGLLRLLAASLTSESKTAFSTEDYHRLTDQIALTEDSFKILANLEEETGLLRQVSENRWVFCHQAVQDYLSASYFADLVDTQEKSFVKDRGWWERTWRFVCSLASDPTHLLKSQAEGPYSYHKAIALADALSQNLLVERSVVAGYGLCVVAVLEYLLGSAQLSTVKDESSENVLGRILIRVEGRDAQHREQINALGRVLNAIYNSRDGTGNSELMRRLGSSRDGRISQIAQLLMLEGRLEVAVEELPDALACRVDVLADSLPDNPQTSCEGAEGI